jgi:hypothetical protein
MSCGSSGRQHRRRYDEEHGYPQDDGVVALTMPRSGSSDSAAAMVDHRAGTELMPGAVLVGASAG